MIPILISLAKRLTSNIIGWFKRNYKAMAVIIITILAAICFYQNNQLDKKNKEIDRVTNNYLYYEQLATQQKNDNRVLQLTLDEFKETKDSLIQEVHATVKKLKIKEKELKQVQIQEQKVVHDTTIVVRSTDFKVEIKPNNLTSIVINKRDTLLTHSIDIRNTQSLFIHTKKEYKRNYKNWFQRLLHFDFKKRTIYKYQIDNSNKLINVENTRIIDLSNNNTVTYGICPFQWRQLPCRGLILLNINHTATGATEGSLVSVATSVSSSQVSSNPTSVNTNSGKALLNGSGDQMPTEEISTGNKYLIYYDKRTGVFQTINHIVAPAA